MAGQAYWQFGDFRLQPENGNLPQRWAALPAWLLDAHYPDFSNPAWRDSDVWTLGYLHFYRLGNNTDWLLFLARATNSLWAAATAALVFAWSRRLFGLAGGFTALLFCLLCPNMLAQAPLATSDMAATFFLIAAVGAFWRHLHRSEIGWAFLSAVTFGLACLAKFSAVLLLPLGAALIIVRAFHVEPVVLNRWQFTRRRSKLLAGLLSLLGHGLVATVIIWAAFDFRLAAANPGLPSPIAYARPWEMVLRGLDGPVGALITTVRTLHLFPDAYLYGLAHVLADAGHHGAFLNGEAKIGGWWWFFPYTFLVKTPPSFLLALAGTACLAVLHWHKNGRARLLRDLQAAAPLWIFFGIYWTSSIASQLNIGLRHVLPTFPVLFVFSGLLGRYLWEHRWCGRLLLGGLLLWSAVEVAAIRPDFLAYFNLFAGGPSQGYRHLVDSSLDWGQDLPGLAGWLASRRKSGDQRDVYLAYFGSGDENYEGILASSLPRLPALDAPSAYRLGPGIYCVSATMLQQPYGPMAGPWTIELEKRYQALRSLEIDAPPSPRQIPVCSKTKGDQLPLFWRTYDWLRFTRLCHYLRAREPVAQIGHSIMIYDVTEQDLHVVVESPLREFVRAIEQMIRSKQ
ncbi:MAG: glycosyltransferase family 39 protein [Opitutaceae bacterium]|nr:glycosyltransferase family 39 protein [Opitutaceae bacterium]